MFFSVFCLPFSVYRFLFPSPAFFSSLFFLLFCLVSWFLLLDSFQTATNALMFSVYRFLFTVFCSPGPVFFLFSFFSGLDSCFLLLVS
ncbi:hypothetical protein FHG64_01260 [Antarcticibacterium flavum]|uniref:Uncharacterized protein n=1 Tax=Antarcticibacterium flavum TaxID=2058175 RepID=A0A5B7X7A6_9FLAO|nr:hypothetical protein [Antarcticibacterium sp. W02-3]QCY71327.1 hypothetical protein FHG64_01260 [Antarcticibacterium flavum]